MKQNFLSLSLRAVLAGALAVLLTVPVDSYAATDQQGHLVSPQAMQDQLARSAADRQKNIETVKRFFSTPIADKAIRDAHYDPQQVQRAIPTLSDQELANLAARSNEVQQEFVAGRLTKTELGLIAVAFVVLIIVIIVH